MPPSPSQRRVKWVCDWTLSFSKPVWDTRADCQQQGPNTGPLELITTDCCLLWDTHGELRSKAVAHTKDPWASQAPDGGGAPWYLFLCGSNILCPGQRQRLDQLDAIYSRPIFHVRRKGIFQQRMSQIVCHTWFKLQDIQQEPTPTRVSSERMWKKPPTAPWRLITESQRMQPIAPFLFKCSLNWVLTTCCVWQISYS